MRISGGTRRIVVIAVAIVIVGGGAGAAYAARSSSGPAYRLATVTSADVTASLNEDGTLTPEQSADVAFTVSGTVATVDVVAGQQVTAGQTLGTLDTTSLKVSLAAARSALANANLKVANDIASQDKAAGGPASAPTPQPSASASSPASSLAPLQQAVLDSQHKADTALALANTAETQANHACTPSPAPSSPSPTSSPPVTCAAATEHVLTDETAVLKDLQTLSGQEGALSTALSQAVAGTSGNGAGSGGSANGSGSSSGRSTSPGGSGSSGGPVSAAQLAADQESADAEAVQVTVAQQNLAGATAVSPISGTVVSVSALDGANASAGSTEFEVAQLDSWQVLTQVPVADMPQLKTGQQASVVPDGSNRALSGAVVTIGLQPTPNSNPVTYPVTIGLGGQPSGLHQGGYAAVTITTGQSSGVSVPTSAVHYSGSKATVTVYAAGKARSVSVRVGTKGSLMTRITSGLVTGQQVVLANLNAPMPNNNPSNNFGGPGPILGGGVFPVGPGG